MKNPHSTFRSRSLLGMVALALFGGCVVAGEPMDKHLVARWTFNSGTLKSDVGGYTLQSRDWGSAPFLDLVDGKVRIGPGTLLVSDKINSTDLPKLGETLTIWIRLRIETPIVNDASFCGLRDQVEPGGWNNLVFCGLGQPGQPDHTSLFARFHTKAKFGRSSTLPELKPGAFHDIAMVFDGYGKTITYYVDGQELSGKHGDATALDAFNNFAIGRLSASAASPEMVVDEIRIYNTALNAQWIGEIEPVAVSK